MPSPVILISADQRPARTDVASTSQRRERPPRAEVYVNKRLIERVQQLGAIPLMLPPGTEGALELLDRVQGMIITGGAMDIHPRHYGQPVTGRLDGVDEERSGMEIPLARAALIRGIPILGICGGMQAMAVALGGTLIQDILTEVPGAIDHEQAHDPARPAHPIRVEAGWEHILGSEVNSTHHQAILQSPLWPIARAPDGVIEAAVLRGHPFALGVQWHPEWIGSGPFDALIRVARARRAAGLARRRVGARAQASA